MTSASLPTVPNTKGTTRRTFRIPDPIYLPAQEKAEERGESLSDVVRQALERYAKKK